MTTTRLKTAKTYCNNGGASSDTAETRRFGEAGPHDITFVKCPTCGRILKPTATGKFRQHQPRNSNTRSLDATRDILWDAAVHQNRGQHFAIGLTVHVKHGAKPVGWQDDEPFVGSGHWDDEDYDRSYPITEAFDPFGASAGSSFEAAGWYWDPRDLTVAY